MLTDADWRHKDHLIVHFTPFRVQYVFKVKVYY